MKQETSGESARTSAFIAMWIAAAIATFGLSIYGAMAGLREEWILIVPMGVALIATLALWFAPLGGAAARQAIQAEEAEKAKRRPADRLSILLELMDADELADFKERLKAQILTDAAADRDGELPYDAATLESLLYDDEAASRAGQ